MSSPVHPTAEEISQHEIKSVEVAFGESPTGLDLAQKLTAEFPHHLVLVQAGKFMHGWDRTAWALHCLKKYKLKLVGPHADPHIQAGFPVAGHERRMWKILEDFGIPYVVAMGDLKNGHKVYQSKKPQTKCTILIAATDKIVAEVIADLRTQGELNASATAQMLKDPESGPFMLKSKAQELDTLLVRDIAKMPRDLRCCYGENVRAAMYRVIRGVMAYGLSKKKLAMLRELSADVDQLKHYLTQSQKLDRLTGKFGSRAGIAVEIGRLVGGLLNKEEEKKRQAKKKRAAKKREAKS